MRTAMAACALCVWMVLAPGVAKVEPSSTNHYKIMTFNIRLPFLLDGRDYWSFRKDAVAGLIREQAPDILGLQETYASQAGFLKQNLPGYNWFGPPREGSEELGERCPIFFRTDRFELIEHDTFWLSAPGAEPGARSWDAAFPRIVTWGKFRDRRSGLVFHYFNTHFDNKGKVARRMSAQILIEKIHQIAGDGPVAAGGDFNATDDSEPYRIITADLADSRLISESEPAGPPGTSRSFNPRSKARDRIDFIFVSPDIMVKSCAILDRTYGNGRRPSDHMPVVIEVEMGDAARRITDKY